MFGSIWGVALKVLELAGFGICAWGALAMVGGARVDEGSGKKAWAQKGWNFIVHWTAGLIALAGGLMLWASSLAKMVAGWSWLQTRGVPIGAIVLAIVLLAFAIADVVGDLKPDRRAVLCALALPFLIAFAVSVWPSSWDTVNRDGHDWNHTVQSNMEK